MHEQEVRRKMEMDIQANATILENIIVDSARGNRNTILSQYIRAKQQCLTSPLPPGSMLKANSYTLVR
jgi:dihydroxyacetone kinase-like predicted kinase